MNFTYFGYFPLLVISFLVLSYLLIKQETRTYLWIEKYWFYKRTNLKKISFALFLMSLFFFLFSLLDLRGPSESKKTNIPDQKTIIIIDSSASMLVEDVRPNRFLKSLLMARHFVKKAYGHQIAVVLFSDVQKRIIPFTDDIELLDSRIEGLEKQNVTRGGSNIGQAISESIQYFKVAGGSREAPIGNILLFTDSDETREDFNIEIPDGINLAVVAVATRNGGPIPQKDQRGNFFGYKNYQGKQIISKLDDSFLKELSQKVKNYKYWEITTYNLPTDEILYFFNNIYQSKLSEKNIDIRPVFTQYVVIFAIFLYIFSVILSRGKSLTLGMIFLCIPFLGTWGSEKKTEDLMGKFKAGELKTDGVLKLAEKLLQENKPKEAAQLYNEISFPENLATSMNHGTALILSGEIDKGLKKYQELTDSLKGLEGSEKEEFLNSLRNNVLMALQENEKQKEKKKQEKEKEQQQKKEKEQEDKQKKEDQKGEGQEKDKKENQQGDNKGKEKKEKEGKEKNKEEGKGKNKEPKKDEAQDPLKEKEEKIKESREKMKVPAKIKQILDDDRKLQQEYLDTSTQGKRQDREVKDW